MTIKELQIIMERAKREVAEEYKVKGNALTLKDIAIIQERARQEEDLEYQRKLNKIRNEAYALNQESGFYGIAGMDYDEFLEAMKEYSYSERMKLAYAFFLHIKLLDNIIFDFEEGEA